MCFQAPGCKRKMQPHRFYIAWEEFLDQLKNLKQTKLRPKRFSTRKISLSTAVSATATVIIARKCIFKVISHFYGLLNVLSLQLLFAFRIAEQNMVIHKFANIFCHRTQTSFWQLLTILTGSFPLHRARK